jgi:hypothetical protein
MTFILPAMADNQPTYDYTVSPGMAGAGRPVWRWVIQHRERGATVASGVSISSEDDAKAAALAAMKRLGG